MTLGSKPTASQKKKLGYIVYLHRSQIGMSQEQLAETLGYSTRWIQKIEAGQANPSWIAILTLMMLLNITPDELSEEVSIRVPVLSR